MKIQPTDDEKQRKSDDDDNNENDDGSCSKFKFTNLTNAVAVVWQELNIAYGGNEPTLVGLQCYIDDELLVVCFDVRHVSVCRCQSGFHWIHLKVCSTFWRDVWWCTLRGVGMKATLELERTWWRRSLGRNFDSGWIQETTESSDRAGSTLARRKRNSRIESNLKQQLIHMLWSLLYTRGHRAPIGAPSPSRPVKSSPRPPRPRPRPRPTCYDLHQIPSKGRRESPLAVIPPHLDTHQRDVANRRRGDAAAAFRILRTWTCRLFPVKSVSQFISQSVIDHRDYFVN